MRALVTGGSGVVGGALIRHLVASGDEVTGVARSPAAAATLAGMGARSVPGDVLDRDRLEEAMADVDVVYHVAGVNDMCPTDPDVVWRVNVDGCRTVVAAAGAAGVGRVVVTSSAAAHESRPTRYGASKAAGAAAALDAGGDAVEVVIVSPASVQGPGRATGTARILLAVLEGRLRWLPDTVVSIVDIDDCARGHRLAATRGRPGADYLLAGAEVFLPDVPELLAAAGLEPETIRRFPRFLLYGLWPAAIAGVRAGDLRLCSDLIREIARAHHRPVEADAAARELGLEYTPAASTVRRLAEWVALERS